MGATTVQTRGQRSPVSAPALRRAQQAAEAVADAEGQQAAAIVLREWLERTDDGVNALLLAHGQQWRPAAPPNGVGTVTKWKCFEAAHRFALRTGTIYVEGYAIAPDGSGPYGHAWVVALGSEEVIDRVWGGGLAYFGMAINDATRRRLTGEDDYGYPIIPEVGFLSVMAQRRANPTT